MNRTGGAAANARQPYRAQRVQRGRQVILDVLAGAARRYPVHALVEFDVTVAEQRLRDRGGAVSWTGFAVATVARAVAAHPELNARPPDTVCWSLTGWTWRRPSSGPLTGHSFRSLWRCGTRTGSPARSSRRSCGGPRPARPRSRSGHVVARSMLPLTVTFDHWRLN